MSSIRVFAPAKVNLTLHVTGQRQDGYHMLDSLVAFAAVGDELELTPASQTSLSVEGPEAQGVPADKSNLALKAVQAARCEPGASVILTKNLPVASGIGGGSADAAAAFRGALALTGQGTAPHGSTLLALGADVPMCFGSGTARVEGIGDQITPLPLPLLEAVLVNPRVPVATPQVFAALASKSNPPMGDLPEFAGPADLTAWLGDQRNDLQPPAIDLFPDIGRVLEALSGDETCQLARMSGSGATCFGIFPTSEAASAFARALRQQHPGWWIAATQLGDQSQGARAQVS